MRKHAFFLLVLVFSNTIFAKDLMSFASGKGFVEGHIRKIDAAYVDLDPIAWSGLELHHDGLIRVHTDSAKGFSLGEHVVLITNNQIGHQTLSDSTPNNFAVRRVGRKRVMISKDGTSANDLAQIQLKHFYKKVEDFRDIGLERPLVVYKRSYRSRKIEKGLAQRRNRGRSLASVDSSKKVSENKIHVVWLLLLMAFLGLVVRKLHKSL